MGKTSQQKVAVFALKESGMKMTHHNDYYGLLQEVIELDYDGLNKVVLFRCNWFDITNGVKVDHEHGIVEVKHTSRLKNYEPFVLAAQATQVCYLPYASAKS